MIDIELKIQKKKIQDLIPSARNARTHSEEQVKQIANSIKEFGFLNPVLVDKTNTIIAGHGRVLAAESLRMKSVPAIVVNHLSEVQQIAHALADNKTALNSGWDTDILKVELEELQKAGYDLTLTAFSGDELAALAGIEPANGKTPDDYVPAEHPIVTQLGDCWILGGHRILCGSATNPKDTKRLMDGEKASMIFTDPPYGVSYASENLGQIKNDELRKDQLLKDLLVPAFKELVKHATTGAAFYIWHASSSREDFVHALSAAGLIERQYLIWVKPALVLGHADYHWNHEPCFYASKEGDTPKFYGARDQVTTWYVTYKTTKGQATVLGKGIIVIDGEGGKIFIQPRENRIQKKLRTVRISKDQPLLIASEGEGKTSAWEVSRDTTKYIHPTQKPVDLSIRATQNSSAVGEIILDLFLGSGSTLIGAEKMKRRCFGMDLDPRWVDAAVRRWQEFTGGDATLEGTKKTYKQISLQRVGVQKV